MSLFQCKSSCNLTDLTTFKITTVYDLNYLRQYYVNPTSNCSVYLCNLTMQMNDQGIYDLSYPNYQTYVSYYIPYMTIQLERIYRIFVNSINKTDDYSYIDYNKCELIRKNNNTV